MTSPPGPADRDEGPKPETSLSTRRDVHRPGGSDLVSSGPHYQPDRTSNLMKVPEVAKRLDVSVSMIYSLCAGGRMPHVRVGLGRGTIRISEEDLTAFLEACRADRPAPAASLRHIKIRPGG